MSPSSDDDEPMDADELKAIRLRLDPQHFAEPEKRPRRQGPGRPPADQVSQKALADFLHISARQFQRYEAGDEIPPLIRRELRRALREFKRARPAKKKGA
jgi:hypothetical protein